MEIFWIATLRVSEKPFKSGTVINRSFKNKPLQRLRETAELFGVEALPTLVIISPAGKIIQTKAGISKDKKEALTALIKKNLK